MKAMRPTRGLPVFWTHDSMRRRNLPESCHALYRHVALNLMPAVP